MSFNQINGLFFLFILYGLLCYIPKPSICQDFDDNAYPEDEITNDLTDLSTIESDFLVDPLKVNLENLTNNVIKDPLITGSGEVPTLKKALTKLSNKSVDVFNKTKKILGIIPTLSVPDMTTLKPIPTTTEAQSIFDEDNSGKGAMKTTFQTNEGVLRGKRIEVPGSQPLVVYFGVPYAAPPVANNRFKPPQTLESWEGEKIANELPPICSQYNPITMNISGEEDCLYLNIFAPTYQGPHKLPVMVFIHGGFFLSGSGNFYPAYQLASRQNVIVITINYRLGVFGFLRLKEVGPSCGNCGILDQIAALTWIRDNIPNIGGNPDRVTVFGQGSGGTCVKLLLTIPRARGLFDTAIAQGGSLATLEEAREPKLIDAVEFVAREAQCSNLENREAIMECLRNMPADNILKVASRFCSMEDNSYLNHPFQPFIEDVTGGKAEGNNFEEIMNKISFNSDTLLISGINSAEGVIPYYPPLLPTDSFNLTSDGNLVVNPESFENKIVPHILQSNNYPVEEASLRKAAAFAYIPWSDPKNPEKLADSSLQMSGDQLFTIPYLRDLKHFSYTHKKLYAYLFNYASKSANLPEFAKVPWFKNGTARGSELVYIFGYPLLKRNFLLKTPHKDVLTMIPGLEKDYQYALTDIAMSEFMMETWATIAKRRKPHLRMGRWPRVKPNDMSHLVIAGMGRTGPLLYTKKDYKAMQSYFWDKFYPDLGKEIVKDEASAVESARKVPRSCLTYKRALWGIISLMLIFGILYTLFKMFRYLARRRRKKFSSTPENPNLIYK